jgi:hypothetical protein
MKNGKGRRCDTGDKKGDNITSVMDKLFLNFLCLIFIYILI